MDIDKKNYSDARKLCEYYYPYYYEHVKKIDVKSLTDKDKKKHNDKVFFMFKKYFIETVQKFALREHYDPELFVKAILIDKFRVPPQFPLDYIWKLYLDYLPGLTKDAKESIKIAKELKLAVLSIKDYGGTVESWLKEPYNQYIAKRNSLPFSMILFAFSSKFIMFCVNNNLDNIYDFEGQRQRIFSLPCEDGMLLLNKIKDILKDDYYDTNTEDNSIPF